MWEKEKHIPGIHSEKEIQTEHYKLNKKESIINLSNGLD